MFVLVSLLLRHWLPHGSLQVGSCTAFVLFTLPLCQYIGSNFMHDFFFNEFFRYFHTNRQNTHCIKSSAVRSTVKFIDRGSALIVHPSHMIMQKLM